MLVAGLLTLQPAFAYKYRTRAQPQPASETASSAASFSFQGLSSTPEKSIRHARNKQPPQQPEDSCKPQGRSSSALKLALVGAALVVCAVKVSLFGWCSLQSHTAAMCSRCCQALTLACYSQKAAQPSLLCRCYSVAAYLWLSAQGAPVLKHRQGQARLDSERRQHKGQQQKQEQRQMQQQQQLQQALPAPSSMAAPGYPRPSSSPAFLGYPPASSLPSGPMFPSFPAPDPRRGRG